MGNNAEISEPMLEEMRVIAQQSGTDVNSLINEAVKKYLTHRQIDELAAYGQANARRLGLKPSDSVRFVREDRSRRG